MRESAVNHVISVCPHVMREVLSRLHRAACTPHLVPSPVGGKGGVTSGGRDLEFAMGMQEGMKVWCHRMLDLLQHRDANGGEWSVVAT